MLKAIKVVPFVGVVVAVFWAVVCEAAGGGGTATRVGAVAKRPNAMRRAAVRERAMVGVTFDNRAGAARVLCVAPDSPAEQAGLRSGDRIVAVDGMAVAGYSDVVRAVGEHRPGEQVRFRVARPSWDGVIEATTVSQYELSRRAGHGEPADVAQNRMTVRVNTETAKRSFTRRANSVLSDAEAVEQLQNRLDRMTTALERLNAQVANNAAASRTISASANEISRQLRTRSSVVQRIDNGFNDFGSDAYYTTGRGHFVD